jgi:replicative DNA helicase
MSERPPHLRLARPPVVFPSSLINAEAEYQMLAAMLCFPEALDAVAGYLVDDDFTEGFFRGLFAILVNEVALGRKPTVLSIKPIVEMLPGYGEFGGWPAMAKMTGFVPLLYDWKGLARDLHRIGRRRRFLMRVAETTSLVEDAASTTEAILNAFERAAEELAYKDDRQRGRSAAELSAAYVEAINQPVERGFLSMRIPSLDTAIGEMRRRDLIIGAGRPGMGKTATALGVALGVAEQGHGVLIVSHEMGADDLVERMLADICYDGDDRVTYEHIRSHQLDMIESRQVCRAHDHLRDLPIMIEDEPPATIAGLERLVRHHKRRFAARGKRLDLIIVDYLQLMASLDPRAKRYEIVTEVSRGLKLIAKSEKVVMFALSQLSREVERRSDKRPTMADLRESGAIEQDADTILLMFRPEYYLRAAVPDIGTLDHEKWERAIADAADRIDFICPKRRNGRANITSRGLFLGDYQAVR